MGNHRFETGIMQNKKLEALLQAKWTEFVDTEKLMAFVLEFVHDNMEKLTSISGATIRPKGFQITVSKCHWHHGGILMWIDFHCPVDTQRIAEGSMLVNFHFTGTVSHMETSGNVYSEIK